MPAGGTVDDALARGVDPGELVAAALEGLRAAERRHADAQLTLPELLAVGDRLERDLRRLLPLLTPEQVARAIAGAAIERTVAEVRSVYLGSGGV